MTKRGEQEQMRQKPHCCRTGKNVAGDAIKVEKQSVSRETGRRRHKQHFPKPFKENTQGVEMASTIE